MFLPILTHFMLAVITKQMRDSYKNMYNLHIEKVLNKSGESFGSCSQLVECFSSQVGSFWVRYASESTALA